MARAICQSCGERSAARGTTLCVKCSWHEYLTWTSHGPVRRTIPVLSTSTPVMAPANEPRQRSLYRGSSVRLCSQCGTRISYRPDKGSLEEPTCQPCRRQMAMRFCAYEPCSREFHSVKQSRGDRTRFCSRECYTATRRMYDDRNASRKAASRARKLRHAETWDGITDNQIFERDSWTCQIRGCDHGPIDRSRVYPDPLSPSIDHIVPLSLGGADTAPNKRAAHLICNVYRGNRMHPDDAPVVGPELAPLGLMAARKTQKPVALPWPKRLYSRTCRWCGVVVTSTRTSRSDITVCAECSHGTCSACGGEMFIVVTSRPPETRRCTRQHQSQNPRSTRPKPSQLKEFSEIAAGNPAQGNRPVFSWATVTPTWRTPKAQPVSREPAPLTAPQRWLDWRERWLKESERCPAPDLEPEPETTAKPAFWWTSVVPG